QDVRGGIRSKWSQMNWENGPLGYPTTGEGVALNGGAYNHFQNGSIYWHPILGPKAVFGAIRARWASLGWEGGWLGFPTSDEYSIIGGRRSDFQGGYITWNSTTGYVAHYS